MDVCHYIKIKWCKAELKQSTVKLDPNEGRMVLEIVEIRTRKR